MDGFRQTLEARGVPARNFQRWTPVLLKNILHIPVQVKYGSSFNKLLLRCVLRPFRTYVSETYETRNFGFASRKPFLSQWNYSIGIAYKHLIRPSTYINKGKDNEWNCSGHSPLLTVYSRRWGAVVRNIAVSLQYITTNQFNQFTSNARLQCITPEDIMQYAVNMWMSPWALMLTLKCPNTGLFVHLCVSIKAHGL